MATVIVTTEPCLVCGQESQVAVDADAFRAWRGGALIQTAFPDMSDPERETLKSGIHPSCWTEMFGEIEEDDDAEG